MKETGNSKLAGGARAGDQRLECWRLADELAVRLYELTRPLLKDDRWLRSQVMSAAFSVPSNIVDGYSRGSNREFAHFLTIARASLAEVEYQLHFMDRVGMLASGEGLENLRELVKRAGQTTYGLLRSVRADTKDDESNRRYLHDDPAEYIAGTPELARGNPSFKFRVSSVRANDADAMEE